MPHKPGRARLVPDDDTAIYTPEAAGFSGCKPDTLYRWRKATETTGVQHGPRFAIDSRGRPYYTRGDLLDFRRSMALATARKARAR